MADYRILGGSKSITDYQRESDEAALKKQLTQAQIMKAQQPGGGNLPAALQLADEYAKARAAGDIQRMNDIDAFAKTIDKGIAITQQGEFMERPGYGAAVGGINATKKGMEQQAEKDVDLQMNPQIKYAESRSNETGKQAGEKEVLYKSSAAMLPQLEREVKTLSELGQKATYTGAGNLANSVRRQVGADVGEGAIARAEYIARVDNQILPLLRDTFGAAFTAKEGESLKATLGDPNKSPEEKDAILNAFIESKRANLETLGNQLAIPAFQGGQAAMPPQRPGSVPPFQAPPKASLSQIPIPAVKYLRDNPNLREQFDAKYGPGASKMILGK